MQYRFTLMGLTLFLLSGLTMLNGQNHSFWCGTSHEDQAAIMADFEANREAIFNSNTPRNGAVIYVPVVFHLVGNSSGTGQINVSSVFRQLCKMNTDFEPNGIQFYLQGGVMNGIKFINDTRIYTDPNSAVSQTLLRNTQNANNDAINIFVNQLVQKDEPGVLGRFYREDDYIIISNGEVIGAKSSLSHEVGHFFGLSHTFYGWEITDYICNQPTPQTVYIGALAVPVEYVDRSKNCFQAADRLCDTPADYNLGLGYSGPCAWNGCAKDPDNEDLTPQTENMMGYFLNCISVFSGQQVSVMTTNYNSTPRTYLRSGYIPALTEINDVPTLLGPANNSTTQYFDAVDLSWEAVPGAQGYVVTVDRFANFNISPVEVRTTGTSLKFLGLSPNLRYYWKVTPVSEYQNCTSGSSAWSFRTSSIMTSTDNQITEISQAVIQPNPIIKGQKAVLEVTSTSLLEVNLEVINLNGQTLYQQIEKLSVGSNSLTIDADLTSGTYLVKLSDERGKRLLKKLIVTD